jgi:hypothetical protein
MREGVAVAKSDRDTLPAIQRELDKLQTLVTDRRDQLNSARASLCRGLTGLIALVTQHPDPHARKQGADALHQFAESMATIVRLAAKNPIADRVRTISATEGRMELSEEIDQIILDEAEPVLKNHPDWTTAAAGGAPDGHASDDRSLRKPITGCCARAASGQAAAPPTSVTNSRRLIITANSGG